MSATRSGAVPLAALLALLAAPAAAEIPIVETDDVAFTVGGYARTLSGVQVAGVRGPDLPARTGLSQSIARLEWKLSLGEVATVEVHDRFALTVLSEGSTDAGLGVGVTPTPARSLDLESVLVDDPGTRLDHDLDRLLVRLYLGDWDVTVGRQAITWGTANLFTVADAWAAFSPFDLDTSQKRGVDALRVSRPLGERLAWELVVADRGSLEDLSGGARLTMYLDALDAYVAAAKQWRELALMAGVSWPLDAMKLRAEVWGAYDYDREEALLPRVTLGWDWFASSDVTLIVEAHFNGAGAAATGDYLAHTLTAPEYARGEVFFVGRWYLGAALAWKLTEQLHLAVSATGNLGDPSALITTSLRYDVAENVDLSLGVFNGVGARSDLSTLTLDSELGAYGHMAFLQLSAFF